MSSTSPVISVLLPVYNAERYVAEAISSILTQTFTDFELIIINDGSTDNSGNVIKQFKDQRIILVEQNNQGLATSLNNGLKIAKGRYIARQDNDDVSAPDRFQKQVEYLEKHPGIGLLGTAALIVDENNKETGRFHQHPLSSHELKYFLLFDNPFVHSSVMIRRTVMQQVGTYYTGKQYFEDYNLWSAIARVSGVANLPDKLVRYREVSQGMSKTTEDYRLRVRNQSFQNIQHYLSPTTDATLAEFLDLYYGIKAPEINAAKFFKKMMDKILKAFCTKENISPEQLIKLQRGQFRSFMRTVFQSALDHQDTSRFKKISIKVKRRLFLILNPEL